MIDSTLGRPPSTISFAFLLDISNDTLLPLLLPACTCTFFSLPFSFIALSRLSISFLHLQASFLSDLFFLRHLLSRFFFWDFSALMCDTLSYCFWDIWVLDYMLYSIQGLFDMETPDRTWRLTEPTTPDADKFTQPLRARFFTGSLLYTHIS